ncbi:SOS response-associated peptidase, partial [candidate division WOR-3 bacterium]|nr:SOS response-associated peptidase [candidate division WOR-3 bacterium]
MCFHLAIAKERDYIEERFDAKFTDPDKFKPVFHISAYSGPSLPVITNENASNIQFLNWGLIPHWVKDETSAKSIMLKTVNARSETIFEKPSFRTSIRYKRCIVIADGFFEWREFEGKKYPYFIKLSNDDAFGLAGIWDRWKNNQTGNIVNTFSIITTRANPLLEMIHNTKKRMPVILRQDDEKRWLDKDIEQEEIKSIFNPYNQDEMKAFTISKLITRKGVNTNLQEVQ